MIELRFGKLTVDFDFSFFAAVTLLMLINCERYVLFGLAACLCHETGHLVAMRFCGVPVKKMLFYGAGVKIVPDNKVDFTPDLKQFAVYLAGSSANFLLACVLSPFDSFDVKLFAITNMVIGAFNLLPLQYLDGGRIIVLAIRSLCRYSAACKAEEYLKQLNVFLILTALIMLAAAGRGNFTLYLTLCYLLFSAALC